MTKDLCNELNLFQYAKRSFEFVIEEVSDEEGWKSIRDNLAINCGVGSIPYIRVIELNKKDNSLILEHFFDGRELEIPYAKETLKYIYDLWKHRVVLRTKTKEGRDIEIICDERKVFVN